MAREPKLKISGNEFGGILTVSYGITNGSDHDGRPNKQRSTEGIWVTRIADAKKDIAKWSRDAGASNRFAGSIEFQHNDGNKMKTLKWEEGYLTEYTVGYDRDGDHVIESFTIIPRAIDVEGEKIDFKWEPGH